MSVKIPENRNGKLYDVAILRVFCILVVVWFHCYQMMWAPAHFSNSVVMYKDLYYTPVQCGVINVAMPLFVFISGYLFEYLLQFGKYLTWGNLLRKKGVRILLPYFLFSLLFMATASGWNLQCLFEGEYWHLWFLPMLFWCFIAGYMMYNIKLNVSIELSLLLLTFIGTIYPEFMPKLLGFYSLTKWFYWFYLGMLFYKYRGIIEQYLGKVGFLWTLLLASCVILSLFPIKYGDSTWYGNLAITCCIVSISCLMSGIDWSKYKVTAPIVKFSAYSFGIYIWHNWVALMLISKTSQRLFGLPELAANHVILFPLCFSLITLAISWGLSWVMMKTKIGKFLIG